MRPGSIAGAVLVIMAVGGAGWWVATRGAKAGTAARATAVAKAPPHNSGTDTMRLVPDGVRVKIEVLNASSERGLARRAMFYLRARGFDVVSMGNADQQTDSSVVIDRSGHPEWAAAAARALGKARVETKLDSSHYLDLTVLLGAAFRAPPQIISP